LRFQQQVRPRFCHEVWNFTIQFSRQKPFFEHRQRSAQLCFKYSQDDCTRSRPLGPRDRTPGPYMHDGSIAPLEEVANIMTAAARTGQPSDLIGLSVLTPHNKSESRRLLKTLTVIPADHHPCSFPLNRQPDRSCERLPRSFSSFPSAGGPAASPEADVRQQGRMFSIDRVTIKRAVATFSTTNNVPNIASISKGKMSSSRLAGPAPRHIPLQRQQRAQCSAPSSGMKLTSGFRLLRLEHDPEVGTGFPNQSFLKQR